MSVIFGFQAFPDTTSDAIDSIDDWGKILTNDIFSRVPASLEQVSEYGDAPSHIAHYHEFFTKMAAHGFTEKDLDFLMYVNTSAYDGIECTHFFSAQECYDKMIRFVSYFKEFEDKESYSRLIDLATNESIDSPVMLNGTVQTYDPYEREKFSEHLSTLKTAVWNAEKNRYVEGEPLQCAIVPLTISAYCQKDIDAFLGFFLKHSKENHLVQGYWS